MIFFLTIIQFLVALALVGVILMQRSEGGGLGVGGSPAGLMSARGAADFLTRLTTYLAILFVALSILLAALAAAAGSGRKIDTSLDRTVAPAATATVDPLSGAAQPAATATVAPAPSSSAPADPLSGATKR